MGVLYPLIAWAGLGLTAVPIVLHLVMRQKPRLLEFPALRFVQKRHETNQRRLRLRHLLLLMLRSAAILLLGLALARPSIQPGGKFSGVLGSQEAPVAAALVFDAAPRMEYRQQNETRLGVAQKLGLWLLGQLPRQSDVAVLDTRLGPGTFEIDLLAAEKRIERLEIVPNSQPLTRVVEEALRRLGQSELTRKEIYIFTDLARSAWPNLASPADENAAADGRATLLQKRLSAIPGVRVYLIDVSVEEPTNYALGELRLSGQVLANRGSLRLETELLGIGRPMEGQGSHPSIGSVERTVELRLLDDQGKDQKRSEESYALGQGESQRVDFRIGSLGVGAHQGFLRVVGQDGLAADDVRFFTVEVRPSWRVLLAAPRPAERYSLFVTEALAPTMLRKRGEARFACDVVDLEELSERPLQQYAAVCLLDPGPLEPAVWKKLAEFAEEGHGVGVFLGRNANQRLDSFNAPLAQQLLPGKLLRQARAPEGDLCLAPTSFQHPILSAFRGSRGAIPWDASPVFRYWELDRPAKGVDVVLPFTDGRPALLERPVGDGRVLTMTTPISDDPRDKPWNLLPVSLQADQAWPYLILVNQTASYLVGSSDQRLNYACGQTAVLKLEPGDQHEIYYVFPPHGPGDPDDLTFPLSPDLKRHELTVSSTERVGNYRVRAGGLLSGVDRGFSVNLATRQTQLDRIDEESLTEVLGPECRVARTAEEIQRDISTARVGHQLFPVLILLVALVLAAEHLVANRFYRQ